MHSHVFTTRFTIFPIQVESTGVSSFTFFLPLGCGANLTAFHLETKRLRSLNCGSGDLIFQPMATEENLEKLERLHIALFGSFERLGQVSPEGNKFCDSLMTGIDDSYRVYVI